MKVRDAGGVSSRAGTGVADVGSDSVTGRRRGQFAATLRRADVIAIAVLVAVPVLVFGIPALAGHPVMPGDDLTQNYPLRVLAGRQIAAGHLPSFDPYIWSGSPLLGDWNAGAAYPLTLLFAVLPGIAAWTANLIVTWVVADTGMFCFLRALRLSPLACFLGAFSFAFAGAMSAQVGHLGLVAGMSWVPVQLLAVLRLAERRSVPARLGWVGVLAAGFGMTILAGEPRAVDDAGVIVVLYAGWRAARAGRRCGPLAVSVLAGLLLGVCLGAVQLLPGLAAISTSQRATGSVALFSSGSLSPNWLLLMLVPDLLGGSGSFGQPAFFASYQLPEVTSYVGILPLVAAFGLLGRLRRRCRLPDWLVWHLIAIVGIVLALGGNTPAVHLLAHLPLFGSQRLQSRNILVTDTALAVLLAYWAHDPLGAVGRSRRPLRWRIDPAIALGLLPPAAVLAVTGLAIWRTGGLLSWLAVSSSAIRTAGSLALSVMPFAILAAAAIVLVTLGRRLSPRRRAGVAAAFVVTDVIAFTLATVLAVPPVQAAAATASAVRQGPARHASSPVRSPSQLGYQGRFAIYDPGLRDAAALEVLGSPDLNVLSATPSVQGYSSIVDAGYATATGSHRATGDGQDVLSPRAIADGTLSEVNTSVLLTVSSYLVTAPPSHGAQSAQVGRRRIQPRQRATWYLGTALSVSKVTLPDAGPSPGAGSQLQVGFATPAGQTTWLPATAATSTSLTVRLNKPVTAIAVTVRAGSQPADLGPPTVTEADGRTVVADGVLQAALTSPQWTYATSDGPFAVFADHDVHGALTIRSLVGGVAVGATVRTLAGAASEPTAVAVQSATGIRVTRAVAYIPGWSATWTPTTGPARQLAVQRTGLIQTVDVPAGSGVVTWAYKPPGLSAGLALSLAAAVVLAVLAVLSAARWLRRRRGSPRSARPPATATASGQ